MFHWYVDMRKGFCAKIDFLTTNEGGRVSAARTGYRPPLLFPFHPITHHDAYFEFVDSEWISPGESCTARVFPSHPEFLANVALGEPFDIREGAVTVARGHVTDFIEKTD